jgi:ribosomal-protein-alanine N-acetyltransferase
MPTIETTRLRMIPLTLERMKLAISDKAKLAEICNVHVPEDWPGADFAGILPSILEQVEKEPLHTTWDGIIIHKADRTIIGDMGLKGGPNEEGSAEVGYSIIPEYRNHGYATEMLQALISWAFIEKGIKVITAECLETNTGSIRVLGKAGLRRVGADGNKLKWEIRREDL